MLFGRARGFIPFALLAVISVLVLLHVGFDHDSSPVPQRISQWWDDYKLERPVTTSNDTSNRPSNIVSHLDAVVEDNRLSAPASEPPIEEPAEEIAELTLEGSDRLAPTQHDSTPALVSDQVESDATDLVITEAPREHPVHEYDPDVDPFSLPDHYTWNDPENAHRILKSTSKIDRKYQLIDYGSHDISNPNVIPHHTLPDTYIVVSQLNDKSNQVVFTVQLNEAACNAKYIDGTLRCVEEPHVLPIANTQGDESQCPEGNELIFLFIGPHDARIFWGPKIPYIIFGSNSAYSCLGLWIQDFRMLIDHNIEPNSNIIFANATELQKPTKYNFMEKNYFVFWDTEEQMYVHHDISPKRTFAKLEIDGSVGPDLGPAANDDACIASHLGGKPLSNLESIHQATNSLAITLCSRSDDTCIPNNENTVIFTIYQHKSVYQMHANYEPYVMAFHQTAPFSIYGFSQKPLYIYGRTEPGDPDRPVWFQERFYDQTEMFYVTSMSWKTQGQKYHGYLDDILLINFGIEDERAATIDVHVSDLFLDMKRCSDPL